MTLWDTMQTLCEKFGYYQNGLISKTFEGQDGMWAMKGLIASLRNTPPSEIARRPVTGMVDYLHGVEELNLSDVLEFCLVGEATNTDQTIRPKHLSTITVRRPGVYHMQGVQGTRFLWTLCSLHMVFPAGRW